MGERRGEAEEDATETYVADVQQRQRLVCQ